MRSFRSWWTSGLLALALVAQPLAASAQYETAPLEEDESLKAASKLLDYAMCAVTLAAATTVVGAVVASITCSKAMVTWWSE